MILIDKLAAQLLAYTSAVYPVRIPETVVTYPCVVIQQISGPRITTLDGPTGKSRSRVQLSCIATTYTDAKKLMDSIIAPVSQGGIDGFQGYWNGLLISGVHVEDERDEEYKPINADDVAKFCIHVDLIIWYLKG